MSYGGETSEEYRWAELRFFYAQGAESKRGFFERFSRLMNEEKRFPVEKVCRKYKWANAKKKQSSLEWFALWKLRFNCARVVCPELLFVSNIKRLNNAHKGLEFYELQKESYEKFVGFVEENWSDETSDCCRISDNPKAKLEFLKALKELPYEID